MSFNELYKGFSEWLDGLLTNDFPNNTAAIVFNLYERFDEEHRWYAELGFSECFDPIDENWACYAKLCDERFMWDDDTEWEAAQSTAEKLVEKYLAEGSYSNEIKALHGVGVGFAEGNLNTLYVNSESTAPIKEYQHYDPEKSRELIEQKAHEAFDYIMNKLNEK